MLEVFQAWARYTANQGSGEPPHLVPGVGRSLVSGPALLDASNSVNNNSESKMGSEKYKLKWSKYETNILSAFHSLLDSESLSDVTLFCEGQTFKAHRLVLAACSTHFETLFSNTLNNNNQLVVILDGTRANDLQILLHFMYRGEAYLHQDRIHSVLRTAEVLQVKGLSEGPRNVEPIHQQSTSRGSYSPNFTEPRPKRPKESELAEMSSSSYYSREQFPIFSSKQPINYRTRYAPSPPASRLYYSKSEPTRTSDEVQLYELRHRNSPEQRRGSPTSDFEARHRNSPAESRRSASIVYSPDRNQKERSSGFRRGSEQNSEEIRGQEKFASEERAGSERRPPSPMAGRRSTDLKEGEDLRSRRSSESDPPLGDPYRRLSERHEEHEEHQHPVDERQTDVQQQHNLADRALLAAAAASSSNPATSGLTASDYMRFALPVRDGDNGDPISGSGTKLKCPFCERTYGYETNLRAHIRQRHQGIRVPCPFCPRTFTRNNTVRRHIMREHRHLLTSGRLPARFGSTRVLPDSLMAANLSAAAAAAAAAHAASRQNNTPTTSAEPGPATPK